MSLDDVLRELPNGTSFAYTLRMAEDGTFVGFERVSKVRVFAKDAVLVSLWEDGKEQVNVSGDCQFYTYNIADHVAEDDDSIYYAGNIDGRITFRVPNALMSADVDYILLQEEDVVRIVPPESTESEFDEYVFSSMGKAFEGIMACADLPMKHWAFLGESLYYIPEDAEPGYYWMEFGFNKYNPKIFCRYGEGDSEPYKVQILHSKISSITPKYKVTTRSYGKIKTGEYHTLLPDMSESKCSVLCLTESVLSTEEEPTKESTPPTVGNKEELAAKILEHAETYEKTGDVVHDALVFALQALQAVFGEEVEPEVKRATEETKTKDLFGDFDIGDF